MLTKRGSLRWERGRGGKVNRTGHFMRRLRSSLLDTSFTVTVKKTLLFISWHVSDGYALPIPKSLTVSKANVNLNVASKKKKKNYIILWTKAHLFALAVNLFPSLFY